MLSSNFLEIQTGSANHSVAPADLEIRITGGPKQQNLSFAVHSKKAGFHHANFGCIDLQACPEDKFQLIYQELTLLTGRSTRSGSAESIASQLSNLGNSLWDELIPLELRNEFWSFRRNIKSILITSDEPWIPWEIIKPYRYTRSDIRENAPFLCQQFALSRWLSGPSSTSDKIYIGTAQPVAHQKTKLAAVESELNMLKELKHIHTNILVRDPIYDRNEVLQWIERQDFSILHFACHGNFDKFLPNESSIHLTNGNLAPSDIKVRFSKLRPLIFINACHGGRINFNFTGLGGWAAKLIEAKVGVFIGAMWEVTDKLALEFARCFYSQLLTQDITIAEAFRQAREEVRKLAPHDSTWLSYVLYAEPNIKLSTLEQEELPPINSLLCNLREAIEQEMSLAEEDKDEALSQVEMLELASQGTEYKREAKTAIKILRGTITILPQDSFLYNFCNSELPKITEFLGIN